MMVLLDALQNLPLCPVGHPQALSPGLQIPERLVSFPLHGHSQINHFDCRLGLWTREVQLTVSSLKGLLERDCPSERPRPRGFETTQSVSEGGTLEEVTVEGRVPWLHQFAEYRLRVGSKGGGGDSVTVAIEKGKLDLHRVEYRV
jgi:hypothetical protein